MRETKLSPIKPSKIKVLTKPGALLKLNKCAGHQYAITSGYRVLSSFESLSLSRHLALQGRKKIRSVRLVDKLLQHGGGSKQVSEMRFEFCDGRTFILDERDRIYALNEVTPREVLYSPYGCWGLVPEEPIVKMVLSGEFVDFVESLCMENQILPVLRSFWNDWTLSKKNHLNPNRIRKIDGEFGLFRAKPLNSKLVKFDTT